MTADCQAVATPIVSLQALATTAVSSCQQAQATMAAAEVAGLRLQHEAMSAGPAQSTKPEPSGLQLEGFTKRRRVKVTDPS